ncbi:protein MMS22-like [Euwallacea similis]|uniref:protein MMS22-like n=1 Tax=Euwallacea similis TaxID=1736056 RepID=UPI00344F4327
MSSDITLKRCSQELFNIAEHYQDLFSNGQYREFKSVVQATFNIDDHTYYTQDIIEDIEEHHNVFFQLVRAQIFQLQEIALNCQDPLLSNASCSRKFISTAFEAIIQSIVVLNKESDLGTKSAILKLTRALSWSLVPLNKLEENVLSKMKYSRIEICPFFQYFHTLLDIYYFLLLLYLISSEQTEPLESHLEYIITNIFSLFKININNFNNAEMCSCMKSFWLVVQLIAERKEPNQVLFWNIFNKVLQSESPLIVLSFLKEVADVEKFNISFKDMGAASERIKPNYPLLENKFRELFNLHAVSNCDILSSSLKIIKPLICDLWIKEGKIDILLIIWDFYSKRLNVSNNSLENISAISLVEILDLVITSPQHCKEDFQIFVGILINYLQKHALHWGKLKGRIYSQLGPNKAKDLTDIGVMHVMILYLALSTVYFNEMEKKMLVFLESLPRATKYNLQTWNIYAAMVLQYIRNGHSIERISPPILRMLQEACTDHKLHHLVKNFISNLQLIVNHSNNMQLHQWTLLGPWLTHYQSVCYFSDLKISLAVLLSILEKCSNADYWAVWEPFFKDCVYPALKQLAVTSTPPPIIGRIAGKLILNCNNLIDNSFKFFLIDLLVPKISSTFLEVVLNCYPDRLILTPEQENVAVQCWVNVCFLSVEPQVELTQQVIKLECFSKALKTRIKESNEPMEAFIEYLGSSDSVNVQSTMHLLKLCETALGNLDKTVAQYLMNPEDEKIVLKIYRHSSLIFLTCGNLIYNRNKPVTILTKLVQVLLLPMDFLMGKRHIHNFVINALKTCWPTFFDAIINLNTIKDPYLERTLRDMVAKYLPLFPTSGSAIVASLETPSTAEVVLDKIAIVYLKPPINEPDGNVAKALKIISDIAKSTTSLSLFRLLIDKILLGLFELIIFHSQRNIAIGVVRDITNSHLFQQVKNEFKKVLLDVTQKNMAINSINYFQLMVCVAKFVPHEMRDVFESIKAHVGRVEKVRGVGFDQSLRLQLERLERAINENLS